jgi:hypothetical protein
MCRYAHPRRFYLQFRHPPQFFFFFSFFFFFFSFFFFTEDGLEKQLMSGFRGQRLVNPERAINARARKSARQNARRVELRALGEDRSAAIGACLRTPGGVLLPDHTASD